MPYDRYVACMAHVLENVKNAALQKFKISSDNIESVITLTYSTTTSATL